MEILSPDVRYPQTNKSDKKKTHERATCFQFSTGLTVLHIVRTAQDTSVVPFKFPKHINLRTHHSYNVFVCFQFESEFIGREHPHDNITCIKRILLLLLLHRFITRVSAARINLRGRHGDTRASPNISRT